MSIRITGTGSYIPDLVQKNNDFISSEFYTIEGEAIDTPIDVVVEKFKAITGISERRYADHKLTASDLGAFAGQKAITRKIIGQIEKQIEVIKAFYHTWNGLAIDLYFIF